jgi:hypothetical protein
MAEMNTRTINGLLRTTVGALDHVDMVNRRIDVLVGAMRLSFEVPPLTEIVLNSDRVKLHVLQPRDTVAIVHGPGCGDCTAIRIEVMSRAGNRRQKTKAQSA